MGMAPKIEGIHLSEPNARRILREAADESGRVFFTTHAEKRMKERRITRVQVLRCLRHGTITEAPAWSSTKGTWELRVEYVTAGDQIRVGAAIDPEEMVIVVTTF